MSHEIIIALLIVAGVLIYVLVKVRFYARKSDQQWQDVDKTRLKEWKDEDDWD